MRKIQTAFTLIELLIVVAIIALLLTILAPALQNAKKQASGVLCMANQKALATGWVLYSDENKGNLVNAHTLRSSTFEHGVYWVEPPQTEDGIYTGESPAPEDELRGIRRGLLYPYIKNVKGYRCPSDERKYLQTKGGYRSYSMTGGLNGEPWGDYTPFYKISSIKFPENYINFVEEADPRSWNMGSWQIDPDVNTAPSTWSWVDPLAPWHNEKSTLGFCDGHAKVHEWQDDRTIDWCYQQFYGVQPGETAVSNVQPNNPDIYFMKSQFPYQELR
ncbi:MAG: type II secretion system protein [Sedimentisphaerales bacterium]|nr:type II secretion system protein [Sedimentisphaerales bacterium]